MELISSVQNPKVKAYTQLLTSSKQRKEKGIFVLEGIRLCMDIVRVNSSEALSSLSENKLDYTVKQLFFTKSAYEKNEDDIEKLISISEEAFEITEHVAEKLSDTKNTQGVFLVVGGIDKRGFSNKINVSGKYILLENVQDPANLGAISRTAEALGITGLMVSGGCDVYSPKALRASMGALLRLHVIETEDVTNTILDANEKGMKTYASTPCETATDIKCADFSKGTIVVIGNEANGVTERTMECCKEKITIRMAGRAESLNAGAAASIIMWEMVTARNDKS